MLELATEILEAQQGQAIDNALLEQALTQGHRRFDKGGDEFYEQISALHKSVRGSAPQASLYWLTRMLDGGCDPDYIARRVVRMAAEDIGNADPRALTLAMDSWQAYERMGAPEGELALAQAVLYMAVAPKSNAVYVAYNEALRDARRYGSLPVPMHLRNAPTGLMRELNYGSGYRYAHDEPEGYAAGERYFPDSMPEQNYYRPTRRGMEGKIKEKMDYLSERDRQYREQNNEEDHD
jgi:putative ATPase